MNTTNKFKGKGNRKIKGNIDLQMIAETKGDWNFPIDPGFDLHTRLDRKKHGGGIMLYSREDVRIILLSSEDRPRGCILRWT